VAKFARFVVARSGGFMPVIVASEEAHPFLPSLASGSAIDQRRALQQDIRPLEIAILNLMADKMTTERQLAAWLGSTPLQVSLTFVATDGYVRAIRSGRQSRTTPAEHIVKFYKPLSDIRADKFDGLIVTGVNALQPRVSDEAFWPEVQEILDWSASHVLSSLYLCWGAKAALKHFHDIESIKGERKTSGLFEHRLLSDSTGLAFGFPDVFSAPVSRWKNPDRRAVANCPALEVVADSEETGPNIIVESEGFGELGRRFPRRVYVLNHPEYETDSLANEYFRDVALDPATRPPLHYFPGDDPARAPFNTWRHTAHLYANWLKLVYEATPFNRAQIPEQARPAKAGAAQASATR
jgi:homoserine O-succinyltransferase/O-acetyltransferase